LTSEMNSAGSFAGLFCLQDRIVFWQPRLCQCRA
jgi:hypothetical protein